MENQPLHAQWQPQPSRQSYKALRPSVRHKCVAKHCPQKLLLGVQLEAAPFSQIIIQDFMHLHLYLISDANDAMFALSSAPTASRLCPLSFSPLHPLPSRLNLIGAACIYHKPSHHPLTNLTCFTIVLHMPCPCLSIAGGASVWGQAGRVCQVGAGGYAHICCTCVHVSDLSLVQHCWPG